MTEPLYSRYASDEEMQELLEQFIEELPERADALRSAFETGDSESLRLYAHQLKGSAGSYGYEPITEAASQLEAISHHAGKTSDLEAALIQLLNLLDRATAEPESQS